VPPIIAVDVMGGDHAPEAAVSGAIEAARRGRHVALVGPADRIGAEVSRFGGIDGLAVTIVDAPDVIDMHEAPLAALRRKPRASIKVAADVVARGEAAACFTAGHTGAALLSAHAAFGVLDGAERPALAVTVPTLSGAAVLIDAGANPECRPSHLRQFGVMGAAYARLAFGLDRPRVGLLSIGEEARKGTDLTREAHALLTASPLAFVGNVEAHELFSGRADVLVCDGFTGNIALKVGEGLVDLVERLLADELGASLLSTPAVADALARFRRRVDAAESGAAPLLGVAGLALVGHGRSTARAVTNGIEMAARLADARIVDRLRDDLSAASGRV
jgi:glycerol-3-phosphate acyltransferase PlsX